MAKKNEEIVFARGDIAKISTKDLLKSDKAIAASLQNIAVTGAAFYRTVHIAACSVLKRVGETGDVRIVKSLFDVLPEGTRSNSLRDWLTAYGPIAFVDGKVKHVKDKEVELTKAMFDPFWKFSPEKPYAPIDVLAMLSAVVKKLEKEHKEHGVNHDSVLKTLDIAIKTAKEGVAA